MFFKAETTAIVHLQSLTGIKRKHNALTHQFMLTGIFNSQLVYVLTVIIKPDLIQNAGI